MEEMNMKLTFLINSREETKLRFKAANDAWELEKARYVAELASFNEQLALNEGGLDLEKVQLAEGVIKVGLYSRGGDERGSARADAIKALAAGGEQLWAEFIGTKDYDRWSGQRCDCSYGMGPKHGSICFSIGLLSSIRSREPQTLTAEEVEASIYYLLRLTEIQAAKAQAEIETQLAAQNK